MPEAMIIFFGQPAKVACDGKCHKAWGMSSRPKIHLRTDEDDDEYEDDYAYLADDELGEAPADPGTSEGPDSKPPNASHFPNKWCVRECERCEISAPGEYQDPLKLIDLSRRFYNCQPHYR